MTNDYGVIETTTPTHKRIGMTLIERREHLRHLDYIPAQDFNFKKSLLYSTLAGSRAYGTQMPESDFDYRGCFALSRKNIFGFNTIEEIESKVKDDCVYFSLKKFLYLASKANPQILESLFVDAKDVIFCSPFFKPILKNRDLFISQAMGLSFGGYAFSQLQTMTVKMGHKSGRREIIEKYGYDTKLAMHSLRLYQSGAEALRTGTLQVKRPNTEELLAIRNGKYAYEDFVQFAYGDNGKPSRITGGLIHPYMIDFHVALQESTLPKTSNVPAIESLLMGVQEGFLRQRGKYASKDDCR